MPNAIFEGTFRPLGRLLEARSVGTEFPTVIDAANGLTVAEPVSRRGKTMGAGLINETVARLRLSGRRRNAKQDEIFPKQTDRLDRRFLGEFTGRGGNVPVTPQEFARRSPRTNSRQRVVFRLRQHRFGNPFLRTRTLPCPIKNVPAWIATCGWALRGWAPERSTRSQRIPD